MKKQFYIFRHGQSSYNLVGRVQGQSNDAVLTELGEEQAREVGRKLADKNVDIIVSSPLLRAQQTARLANLTLHLPVIEDNRFTEVNVGEIEGMHYEQVMDKYGEKYKKWRSNKKCYEDLRFVGGESKKEVRTRIFLGLEEYATRSPYTTIAISSHGIMITQLLLSFGIEQSDIPNGSILSLTYENGEWAINGFI